MNGILNIHKPPGITSRQAVNLVQRAYGLKKVGHAGTLDPFASGVLVVCLGRGTKIAQLYPGSAEDIFCNLEIGC